MLSSLISTNVLVAARDAGGSASSTCSWACVSIPLSARPARTSRRCARRTPTRPMPEDGYGWEQALRQRLCRHFAEDFGLRTRVARYHNVYGPHGTWRGGREKAPAALPQGRGSGEGPAFTRSRSGATATRPAASCTWTTAWRARCASPAESRPSRSTSAPRSWSPSTSSSISSRRSPGWSWSAPSTSARRRACAAATPTTPGSARPTAGSRRSPCERGSRPPTPGSSTRPMSWPDRWTATSMHPPGQALLLTLASPDSEPPVACSVSAKTSPCPALTCPIVVQPPAVCLSIATRPGCGAFPQTNRRPPLPRPPRKGSKSGKAW